MQRLLKLNAYRAIFRCLSDALSKPIEPDNSEIDYVPTQYFAEAIKTAHFGGIKYKINIKVPAYPEETPSQIMQCWELEMPQD